MQEFEAELNSISKLSERTKLFTLLLPEQFTFEPGQFIIASMLDNALSRSYSIASSPLQIGRIELCISLIPGGKFSTAMHSLKIGDKLRIKGPYGNFKLKDNVAEGTLFVAGGTGISPIVSMLRMLYTERFTKPLKLFYGIRNSKEFLYREELETYAKEENLKLTVAASEEDDSWTGEKGLISEVIEKSKVQPGDSYICGPPAMVKATIEKLRQLGFSDTQINKEQW